MDLSGGVPTLSKARFGINNLSPTEIQHAAKVVVFHSILHFRHMHGWCWCFSMVAVTVFTVEDSSHSLDKG